MDPALIERISELRSTLAEPAPVPGDTDVAATLFRLLHRETLDADSVGLLQDLARRIDITGSLHAAYDSRWRKLGTEASAPEWLEVLALLLYTELDDRRSDEPDPRNALKLINVLLKFVDSGDHGWLATNGPLADLLSGDLEQVCQSMPIHQERTPRPVRFGGDHSNGKTLPLTVLFYEGPIARAYLETLRSIGLKPARIVQLVSSLDLQTGKPVGRFMPPSMRSTYAENVQRKKIHYWPGFLLKNHPGFCDHMISRVSERLGFDTELIERANAGTGLDEYTDAVETLLIENLRDPVLHTCLEKADGMPFLYTGGGIVPASLLDIPAVRLLHVHPGHLPDIRGADCLLWSCLLHGRPSASAFWMAKGIDTGEILKACWLPELDFDGSLAPGDRKMQYRAAYAFLDPWVRAWTLREVLTTDIDLDQHSVEPQDASTGMTWHFMHPVIRDRALDLLFRRS